MPPINTDPAILTEQFKQAQEASVIEVADQGLATLADMVSSGAIDVAPKFQRRDRWDAARQSKLIESFLINVPVPPVYLAEDAASIGSYAVIDGKQRLTAVAAFFANNLMLRNMDNLPDMNGMRFGDLPGGIRAALGMKSLRVTTLLRQSSEDRKHEVFLRLNTGGEILNAQEIRNVAFRGRLNDAIYKLAENEFLRTQFKVHAPSSPAYKNMTDAEYVLRFLALEEHWKTFSGGLRQALDAYMSENRFMGVEEVEKKNNLFKSCIESAEAIWGSDAFKRPGRDQALAGMYDAQMLALSALSNAERQEAVRKGAQIRQETTKLFDVDAFEESVRRATNTPERLRFRVNAVHNILRD